MEIYSQKLVDELNQAIDVFIQRQSIVAMALKNIGLDIQEIGQYATSAWSSGETSKILYELLTDDDPEKAVLKKAIKKNIPQQGSWNDEYQQKWNYFLHGKGCKLTNAETGEPIDWDCPDISRCHPWKFAYHLKWQLDNFPTKYPVLNMWVIENGIDKVDNLVRNMTTHGYISKEKIR